MVSNLRDIINKISQDNEIKVEGYKMDKIKLIEKHLDADGDVEKAMQELDSILGYKWDDYYSQIKEMISRK